MHSSVKSLKSASNNVINDSWGNKTVVNSVLATNVSCYVLTVSMFIGMDVGEVSCSKYLCHHQGLVVDEYGTASAGKSLPSSHVLSVLFSIVFVELDPGLISPHSYSPGSCQWYG